ncbi:hypothetical protein HGRIS_012869 [Hohenbuehelia grisea]|uniref:Uncharacterized protein n=1 Tax=Hohenbuehelia grisea TaxID=104357 RepID=A0ABR3ITQ5_9AGAR
MADRQHRQRGQKKGWRDSQLRVQSRVALVKDQVRYHPYAKTPYFKIFTALGDVFPVPREVPLDPLVPPVRTTILLPPFPSNLSFQPVAAAQLNDQGIVVLRAQSSRF